MKKQVSSSVRERLIDNKNQTFLKLLFLTFIMFGFGFMLVPFYEAICEATGINVLAAREKTEIFDVKKYLKNTQVDTSRSVIVEFDSNSHGPWVFKPENSSVTLHPGELITVNFKVTNPSSYPISGRGWMPTWKTEVAMSGTKNDECLRHLHSTRNCSLVLVDHVVN